MNGFWSVVSEKKDLRIGKIAHSSLKCCIVKYLVKACKPSKSIFIISRNAFLYAHFVGE